MSYLNESQLGQLLRPLNARRVHKTQGQSHMESYDIRAHLNRIFGFGRWSGEVIEMAVVAETFGKNKSGKDAVTVVYRAGYRLTVRALDGETLATYTEYASGDAQNFPVYSLGDAHDFAMKTAESQALKRAAINLGDQFGLSLYNKGSLGPLVAGTLASPDADPAKDGVDDGAPEITPEEAPQFEEAAPPTTAPATVPAGDAGAAALGQYRKPKDAAPDWQASFVAAKGSREKLTALRATGKRAGLPDDFGMFAAIDNELKTIAATAEAEAAIEGKLVDA